jgi:hypothetical protein
LVGWWQAEGNGYDAVGGHDGVLQNVGFTNGVVGQAFAFDPENYPYFTYTGVQIADQPEFALTNSLSIEAWVRPRGDGYVIFFRGDHRPGLDPYTLSMQGNNILAFGVTDAGGNSAFVQTPLVYNQWWHVAGTLDGSLGTLSLYTNGSLAAQSNTTIRPFGALIPSESPGVGIGNVNDGGNVFPFVGDIDEIALYNRALSLAEIQAIYNAGSAGKCLLSSPTITSQPTNAAVLAGGTATFSVTAQGSRPISYQWNFGGAPLPGQTNATLVFTNVQLSQAGTYSVLVSNAFGSVLSSEVTLTVTPPPPCVTTPSGLIGWWKADGNALDAIGRNDGVLQNISFGSGVVGQAFACDPENYPSFTYTGVQIADQPLFALTNSLSIEAWIRPRGDGYVIFFRGDHRPGLDPYALSMQGNNILAFAITDADGNNASVQAPLVYNEWWHVAGTLDGASGALSLYTNGILAAQATTSVRPFGALLASESPGVGIGNVNDGGNMFPFLGDIDEISLYSRALSPAEIQSIYKANSGGKCLPPTGVPVIQSFAPESGTNGAVVVISGNSFSPTASSNVVFFGAVRATVLNATTTTLTVAVPPGATFGPITVAVNGLMAYSMAAFQPTFAGSGAAIDASIFAPGVNLAAPAGPIQVALADFDGDGTPDLAVASAYAHTVSIYQNIGSNSPLSAASFGAPIVLPVGSDTDDPLFVVAADVDGDGKPDLVIPNRIANQVVIYRNISAGGTLTSNSFAPAIGFEAGVDPRKVAVQDLDGDGRPDIVVANYANNTLSILRNIGTAGTLASNSFSASFQLALASGPDVVAIGDLDGDGKPDLAVGNGAVLSLFRNVSAPGGLDASSFASRVDLPVPDGAIGLVVGDLDGDGRPDLLLGSYLGETMSIYQNLATPGSLTEASFASRLDFVPGGRFHVACFGDLNGDAKPEVAIVTELPSHLSVFQNQSTPGNLTTNSLGARVDFASGWNAWGVAVGDLDGDGRPDVVFGNAYDATLTLYRNVSPFMTVDAPPQISSVTNQHTPINTPTLPLAFTVSDPDNSADTLQVTAFSSNTNIVPNEQIVLGGMGTNRTVTITPASNQVGSATIQLTVTDPGGLSASSSFTLAVDQFTQISLGIPLLQYSSVAWGDYDNDGQLDLLVTGTTNGSGSGAITRIYHNTGGSFSNFISLPGVYKSAVAWADYDRDGLLDFIVTGLTTSNTAVARLYHNNGNGIFTNVNAGLSGVFSGSVAWGDFSNDGAPDLFLCGLVPLATNGLTTTYTNISRLYRNDGGSLFTDLHTSLPGPNSGTAAWGDYDNDGRIDLLLVGTLNNVSGIAAIYRNLGSGIFSNINAGLSTYISGGSAAWADFDNDGRLDVVIANNQTGPNYLYRNTGSGFAIVTNFSTVSSPATAWGDFDNDGRLDLLIAGSPAHLYHNNANGTFSDVPGAIASTSNGSVAWGDYNGDGSLDLVQTGVNPTSLLRNNSGVPNTPPTAPANLVGKTAGSNSVVLTWDTSVDAQTPLNGLSYNLRVGTTPGGFDVMAPQADLITGQRRLPTPGNASPTNRALLINLPKGTYYWSVQGIDTAFAGSPFGSEGTFVIENARPTISPIPNQIIAPNSPTANLPFTIGDAETSASNLVVTARSSNTNVVGLTNIVLGGFGSNRTVRVTPRLPGVALITVNVTDGQGAFATADFTVTAEQFTLVPSSFLSVQNSALAWGDYDNDGRLDVVICGNTNGSLGLPPTIVPATALYHNDGNGNFTRVQANLPNVTFGSLAWADFDNDGKLDLLITGSTNSQSYGGLARVYRNNGNGTFTNINAGLPGVFASAAAWGDYDNDGRPDILLSGSTNGSYTGAITRLYHNNGDGTFSNAVSFIGIFEGAVAFADLDGDGRLDIVFAGMSQNNTAVAPVYRNNGNGSFTQVASLIGVYSCSLAIGDFDNDGRPDILLSGYNGSFVTRVFRNLGNFSFSDIGAAVTGLTSSSVAWGDFDNDGRLDILISGSTVPSRSGGMSRVYRNTGSTIGSLTFTNYPVNLPTNSSGAVAWADFDNDGDLDILITGSDGVLIQQQPRSQTFLFRNNSGNINSPPTVPTTLTSSRTNNVLTLTWAKSADAQTTNSNGLKYQIRVGTSPGAINIESPGSDVTTGYRRIVQTGDSSTNRWLLSNLPAGTYYWSVQAIDTCFVGSPFSAEASVTVTAPPIALYDLLSTQTNTPVSFPAAKLLVNDSSPDGFPLTVTATSTNSSQGGRAVLVGGQIFYTPPPADSFGTVFTGIDTFAYTVADDHGGSSLGAVIVTVGAGYQASLNIVSGPRIDGGDFVVVFAGIPGFTYTIESAPSAVGPWTKTTNATAPTTDTGFGVGVFEFREPMGTDTMRFYRTVYPAY